MGNNSTKESRGLDSPSSLGGHRHHDSTPGGSGPASPTDRHQTALYSSRPGRGSRPDLSFLGISSSAISEVPERRETKQEKEARKLEKERVAREKERARSIKEEHVDGGYLVTMGVYTGIEDFSKPTVRQLMIERRIAPFWRGLDDFSENWTEYQLIAAARGLPIPAADEIPPEDTIRPLSPDSPRSSANNINNLTVPITSRSHSAASDTSSALSPSHPVFSLPSPVSPSTGPFSSPFRPRSKTLASLTTSSKNQPQTELVPREVQLPRDPFVNGQALEVFLYKDATECPICFLYYPPYLNKTRCCDQPICSECFVQIKRPDPHPPEHEHNDPSNPATPQPEPAAEAEALVSEPATCPYCQQAEFGVTYDAPPFRRGLSHANPVHGIASFSSAMSSSSSLGTANSPTLAPVERHKRRTTSISATASTVITTDRVRPDWATKLANARSHLARRSAAATALHTAAYLIGNGASDSRSFGFGSRSRFGRSRGDSSPAQPANGAATPPTTNHDAAGRSLGDQLRPSMRDAGEGASRRRSRMDDLEEMMMMEAIRLSLAAEEDRKRKSERDAQKDAKKRAKEEKKKEKKEKRVYGSGASSASGSALSLSLPGIGRRRGNSGGSNLAREVTYEVPDSSNTKGKSVDRGVTSPPSQSVPIDYSSRSGSSANHSGIPGARHLDTTLINTISDLHGPAPSPTAPEKPSHLRQMSNASSPSSSFVESLPGSLRNGNAFGTSAHGSSSSLNGFSGSGTHIPGSRAGREDEENGSAGSEPMFNFRSLAEMIGSDDPDDKDMAKHIEHLEGHGEGSRSEVQQGQVENSKISGLEESVAKLKVESSDVSRMSRSNISQPYGDDSTDAEKRRQTTLLEPQRTTPMVMITPVTPAPQGRESENTKQLGASWELSGDDAQESNGTVREVVQ